MSKELADALRATLPVLQHATLFGTPAQQADAKRRRDAAAAALVAWDTRHSTRSTEMKIVITTNGGVITCVYCDDPEAEVVIIDGDDLTDDEYSGLLEPEILNLAMVY